MMAAVEYGQVHFSTRETPARDRLSVWREVIGRTVLRLDISPLPDAAFEADVKLQSMPGLAMLSGVISGSRSGRTRELLADGIDDVGLCVNVAGPYLVSQGGGELVLKDGDATFFSCAEPNSFSHRAPGRVLALRVPRAALGPLMPKVQDDFLQLLPATTPALRLLTSYLGLVRDDLSAAPPAMRRLIADHVHDLLVLTLGATGDAAEIATNRGVRAARLRAIKADITAHLGEDGLSVTNVAARHRVTSRYVQRLFAANGTTFSEFVLEQRLVRAQRLLTSPRWAGRTIAAIAFAAGFGDLSYFNHCFRRRFAATPSDLRADAITNRRDPRDSPPVPAAPARQRRPQ
jgi:AraC-like DNA-binding protein